MTNKTKTALSSALKKTPSPKVLFGITVGIILILLAYIAILLLSTR